MKRSSPFLLTVALSALAALAACSGSDTIKGPGLNPDDVIAARKVADEAKPALDTVVRANNAFTFDLYRKLAAKDGNLFFSPFSVSTAFAMAWAGARGRTAGEMADVLHFSAPDGEIHDGFDALLTSLNAGAKLGGYELATANRLWGQEDFGFEQAYLDLTRESYKAGLEPMNFKGDPESCRQTINRWVEDQTKDRIKDLLPQGSIIPDTRLVLTNAIYFKGQWLSLFDKDKTGDAPFHVTADRDVTVPMMHQEAKWKTGGAGTAQILELPYEGRDLSMLVLLPAPNDDLANLEASIDADRLATWRDAMHETTLDVSLPRFSVTSEFSLGATMADLGMPTAFTEAADFSGISSQQGLMISDAVHKAFVKVNEEGTEAAAATGIVFRTTSVTPSFRADRPFLFLILDNLTGSVLFMGRVTDPSQES